MKKNEKRACEIVVGKGQVLSYFLCNLDSSFS